MADEPYHRAWKMQAPDYGGDPDRFSVSICHNGNFLGLHEMMMYYGGSQDYFDNCNADTWSLLWIHDFMTGLGIEINEKLQVFWCKPEKDFSDGLVCIESDADIVSMIEAARVHKSLDLFVDHTNFVKVLRSDVLNTENREDGDAANRDEDDAANREEVAGRNIEEEVGANSEEIVQNVVENKRRGKQVVDDADEYNSETDSDFYDSDFDAEDGDDDIFASTVDRSVNDNNEPLEIIELENDAGLENDDLQLSKEQKDELDYRFKQFNAEVDMENPDFKTGMVFANVKELRSAIKAYSVKERVKIKKVRNEPTRINAVCVGDCPVGNCSWFLNAADVYCTKMARDCICTA